MTITLPSTSHGKLGFPMLLFCFFLISNQLNAQDCTNILGNPDFENGLSNWSTTGNAQSSTDAETGTFAAEMCGDMTSSLGQILPTSEGMMYRASISGKILNPNTDNFIKPYVRLRFLDANYAPILMNNPLNSRTFAASSYVNYELYATAPANAAFVHLLVWKSAPISGCLYIDNTTLCEGVAPPDSYVYMSCPYDKTLQLEPGATTAYVGAYGIGSSSPTACNPSDTYQSSGLPLDGPFPLGTHEVCYTRSTACGDSETCCFNVIVEGDNTTCNLNNPVINAISCTEDSITFDILVTGTNTSGTLFISTGPGINDHVIIPENELQTLTLAQFDNTVNTVIIDANDATCTTNLTVSCPTTGDGVDLELTASGTVPDIYQMGTATFILTNNGTETASGIELVFNKNNTLNILSTPTVSQGTPLQHWTETPSWAVGTLAAGQSATITCSIFTLSANVVFYGQVTAQNETDTDSAPNNGNGSTPMEDDEASYGAGPQTEFPDYTLSNLTIQNQQVSLGENLNYSYHLSNIGEIIADGYFLQAWISTDDVLDANDIMGGTVAYAPFIDPNEMIMGNGFSNTALLSPGDYFLILEVDANDEVPESNENNNTIVGTFTVTSDNTCQIQQISVPHTICSIDNPGHFNFIVDLLTIGLSPPYLINYTIDGVTNGPTNGYVSDIPYGDGSIVEITYSSAQAEDNCSLTVLALPPQNANNCQEAPGIDLEVSTDFELAGIYEATTISFTVSNTGAQDATGVKLRFDKNNSLNITDYPTTTQGIPNQHWTQNPVWFVGDIPAGASATIEFPVFIISNYVNLFAEVESMNGDDIDSQPNNGDGMLPNEDDEASAQWAYNNGEGLVAASRAGRATYLDALYPNPVYFGKMTAQIHSNIAGEFQLACYNAFGQVVLKNDIRLEEGRNEISLDVSDLVSGAYYLQIIGQEWRKMPTQFVVAPW